MRETVDARKQRFTPDELLGLLASAATVIVAKGRNSVRFDLRAADLDRDELLRSAIGPSGNLRAPAARVGSIWLIGFAPDSWRSVLGG